MMELWPFTNFHDLNLDWIVKTIKVYTKKVDDFIADITETWQDFRGWTTGEIDQMHEDFAEYVNVTQEALNTGAIADGSITKVKINTDFLPEISNSYGTPEMYGAVGDGITDDTQAIIDALDNHDTVILSSRGYKITSTIELTTGKRLLGAGAITTVLLADCDAVATTGRNIEIGGFQITSATPGSYKGIHLGGSNAHLIDIHNLYINKFQNGIYSNLTVWDCNFKMIRLNECTTALNFEYNNVTLSVFENVYTSYCERALYLTNGSPLFLSCNFGIGNTFPANGYIRIVQQASPTFICCNFEADEDFSSSNDVFNLGNGHYLFERCSFNMTNATDVSLFGNENANCKSVTFDRCSISDPSGTLTTYPRTHPLCANDVIGVIRFRNCENFTYPTNYPDAKYSCWVNETGRGIPQLISASTVQTNVTEGQLAYYAPSRTLKIFDGTNWTNV